MTKIKFDHQIVSIAKVNKVSTIYGSDDNLGVAPFPWTVERLGHKRLSTGCAPGAFVATERAGLWVTACSGLME